MDSERVEAALGAAQKLIEQQGPTATAADPTSSPIEENGGTVAPTPSRKRPFEGGDEGKMTTTSDDTSPAAAALETVDLKVIFNRKKYDVSFDIDSGVGALSHQKTLRPSAKLLGYIARNLKLSPLRELAFKSARTSSGQQKLRKHAEAHFWDRLADALDGSEGSRGRNKTGRVFNVSKYAMGVVVNKKQRQKKNAAAVRLQKKEKQLTQQPTQSKPTALSSANDSDMWLQLSSDSDAHHKSSSKLSKPEKKSEKDKNKKHSSSFAKTAAATTPSKKHEQKRVALVANKKRWSLLKRSSVRIEHVKHSTWRTDFLTRVKDYELAKKEAKKAPEGKRFAKLPIGAHVVSTKSNEPQFLASTYRKDFHDRIKHSEMSMNEAKNDKRITRQSTRNAEAEGGPGAAGAGAGQGGAGGGRRMWNGGQQDQEGGARALPDGPRGAFPDGAEGGERFICEVLLEKRVAGCRHCPHLITCGPQDFAEDRRTALRIKVKESARKKHAHYCCFFGSFEQLRVRLSVADFDDKAIRALPRWAQEELLEDLNNGYREIVRQPPYGEGASDTADDDDEDEEEELEVPGEEEGTQPAAKKTKLDETAEEKGTEEDVTSGVKASTSGSAEAGSKAGEAMSEKAAEPKEAGSVAAGEKSGEAAKNRPADAVAATKEKATKATEREAAVVAREEAAEAREEAAEAREEAAEAREVAVRAREEGVRFREVGVRAREVAVRAKEEGDETGARNASPPAKMPITKIHARQIFDSRGNPTVEVDLTTERGVFRASVPSSGAAIGGYGKVELRDEDMSRYHGKGVTKAVDNINKIIAPELLKTGLDVVEQKAIDDFMLTLDPTPSKCRLGTNAILGVSMAVCKAGAAHKSVPLYRHIADLAGIKEIIMPVPVFTVINARRAGDKLAMQEFMILPTGAPNFSEAMRMGSETYHHLQELIKAKYGLAAADDDDGCAPDFQNNQEAIDLLVGAIEKAGYTGKIEIGLNACASRFRQGMKYEYEVDSKNPRTSASAWIGADTLKEMYLGFIKNAPVTSIEDPFAPHDWVGWASLTGVTDIQIVGGDLTVGNRGLIETAMEQAACNGLLLKGNQFATVSASIGAHNVAKASGWGTMVSHRSGETEDCFIADLVVGLATGQIKTGAPCRSERLVKYNQMLRIEEELGSGAKYAGKNFRRPV